jgi:RPA family protein
MAQIKRETANLCRVTDILNGTFIKAEGWSPSYFITPLGNLSRVNLLGVIVSKDAEGLVLDDGTGNIRIRSFDNNSFEQNDVGDCVNIIGRPRMYGEQRYVLPEIIKKTTPAWAEFRNKHLELARKDKEVEPETQLSERVVRTTAMPVEQNTNARHYQKIIEFIKDLDSGEGAQFDEVVNRTGIPNGTELIRRLIEEGEIFEIKPGKLKVLE